MNHKRETIRLKTIEQQYNEMVGHLHAIDITKVIETDDQTELNDQVACAGGICEL